MHNLVFRPICEARYYFPYIGQESKKEAARILVAWLVFEISSFSYELFLQKKNGIMTRRFLAV